jgi:hypothetical protein
LRCINVPDYIRGGVVNVFAEKNDGIAPPQILARQAIDNLGTLVGLICRAYEVPDWQCGDLRVRFGL